MDLMIKPFAPRRNVSKSRHRKQQKLKKRRERRETVERLKTDMVEIGEGQTRIREGQREIRQKFEEIESECRSLREETMNITSQSDYNQIRINLMFAILKARQDSDFSVYPCVASEEMEKHEQGGKAGLVG
ncbi:golgin subfamily member protein [Salix suchowensis]|nr:golgin subfamily member protein [Salix suchowensis]